MCLRTALSYGATKLKKDHGSALRVMRLPAIVRDLGLAGEMRARLLSAAGSPQPERACGRRMLGLAQYCGLFQEDYHVGETCGTLRFQGSTRVVQMSTAGADAERAMGTLYGVLCLRNAGQALALLDASSSTRHEVCLLEGDLLVVPTSFVFRFGEICLCAREEAAMYFVALFCPCRHELPRPLVLCVFPVPEARVPPKMK